MAVRPNSLFFTIAPDPAKDSEYYHFFDVAREEDLGLIMLAKNAKAAFGLQKTIRLWLHERSPNWDLQNSPLNWNLAFLVALRLAGQWQSGIQVVTVVKCEDDVEPANKFLKELADKARLPVETELRVETGTFSSVVESISRADLNVFGIGKEPDFKEFQRNS